MEPERSNVTTPSAPQTSYKKKRKKKPVCIPPYFQESGATNDCGQETLEESRLDKLLWSHGGFDVMNVAQPMSASMRGEKSPTR